MDILVNSAGIGVMGSIDNYRLEDFDRTLAVNVRAVFVATQAAVCHRRKVGASSTLAVATPIIVCHLWAAPHMP